MFKMKYSIIPCYLPSPSKRRSGRRMNGVNFVVAHDTGNPRSTAKNNTDYYRNSCNDMSASAHIFVDDKEIRECIPLLTGTPEKAWHVLYSVTKDNQLFGCDANDSAAGVELCYGGRINIVEAYKRYIWVIAYIMYKFKLNPRTTLTGHYILDPRRKTDPKDALRFLGKSFNDLINDVCREYAACTGGQSFTPTAQAQTTSSVSKDCGIVTASSLNVREGPGTNYSVIGSLNRGASVRIDKVVGDWVSIYFGAHGGYVSKKYLTMPNNIPTPSANNSDVIRNIQKFCNELGFTDANGNRLQTDGISGPRTRQAVNKLRSKITTYPTRLQQFFKDNGITDHEDKTIIVDGIAGARTYAAFNKLWNML